MSYSLTLSNGSSLPSLGTAGLPDGTADTGSTSLALIGKNYPGYGKLLNENFLYLLENFANTKSPAAALPGQIWWDSGTKVLKVNTAAAAGSQAVWKSLSSIFTAEPIADSVNGTLGTPKNIPYAPTIGDLWWDISNKQLKLYTGEPAVVGNGGWLTIGPVNNTTTGQTGATPDTIIDNTGISRVVLKFYVGNTLTGILSKDVEFTPGVTEVATEFPTVKPGFNLSATIANNAFNGTATAAKSLIVDGVAITADKFARNDISTPSTVAITTISNDGVKVGTQGNVVLDVDSLTGTGRLRHTISGENISICVNQLGVTIPVITANSVTGRGEVTAPPLNSNDLVNKNYVDTSFLAKDGSVAITGPLVPSANSTVNLGSSTAWFANIYGVSMKARYADLAERYAADAHYEPGTVVQLGGTHEITAVVHELSNDVFGVISTDPAYLMNASAGTDATHPAVTLAGRVPVKVIGTVKKGDRLVSAGNGLARAATVTEVSMQNVVGRALADKKTEEVGLVEASVRINI